MHDRLHVCGVPHSQRRAHLRPCLEVQHHAHQQPLASGYRWLWREDQNPTGLSAAARRPRIGGAAHGAVDLQASGARGGADDARRLC